MMQKTWKMIETLENGYSSESTQSTQRELSNEYQHDRVQMVFKDLVLWTKVASALKGLTLVAKKVA